MDFSNKIELRVMFRDSNRKDLHLYVDDYGCDRISNCFWYKGVDCVARTYIPLGAVIFFGVEPKYTMKD